MAGNRIPSLISDDEVARISFGLRLTATARQNKKALQELCIHYEANRVLRDASDVRQLIHSHLGASDIYVRRWAIKAIGLIGNPSDINRIIDRLKVESDYEAITWGAAALFRYRGQKGLKDVLSDAGHSVDKALTLAARLYSADEWIAENAKDVTVSLSDTAFVLKWATFLIGYNKAPATLFSPKFSNDVFLGQLNGHDNAEVSEYSLWAMWERPEYDATYTSIELSNARKQPENVRKWLYRLYLKSHNKFNIDTDIVNELRSQDNTQSIEGLARGVVDAGGDKFDSCIIDWFGQESDTSIKTVLLNGIVQRGDDNLVMREIAEAEFKAANTAGRHAILSAAAGKGIYAHLKRIELLEKAQAPNLFVMPNVTDGGVFNMTAGNAINVGRDMNAQTVSGGDIVDSAHGAVQSINHGGAADQEVLTKVLEFLKDLDPKSAEVRGVYEAVEMAAKDSSPKNKKTLLERLKPLTVGLSAAGALAKIITLVTSWIN